MTGPWEPDDLRGRLARAQEAAGAAGIDALLLSPGPDLRYLTGYQALPLERLTCLVLPAAGDPVLVLPALEEPAAAASPLGATGIATSPWDETDDPYARVASVLGAIGTMAVDNHMWAEKVLRLRAAIPGAEQRLAGEVLGTLRRRKSPHEVQALREAGAAIDRVHAAMGRWLRAGRTEREVAADIAEAIRAEGHASVDFVIVGSGPNGASPHHEVSDRVIESGDPVVVDIGGTTEDGYCSDSTRTYAVGEAPATFREYYEVLRRAQSAAVESVVPGIPCEDVDATARRLIAESGYGDRFIHRIGHGIGLETHEEPYLVAGSTLPLEPGMVFSVEPGIYLAGQHGARIEDIVVCTDAGVEPLNRTTHELAVLPA